VKLVTAETARMLKCPPQSVDIQFAEGKKSDWPPAGELASDT
jgi:phenylpyruvate tautomerase PptA (4-oxalocrotonate tautomerase family)